MELCLVGCIKVKWQTKLECHGHFHRSKVDGGNNFDYLRLKATLGTIAQALMRCNQLPNTNKWIGRHQKLACHHATKDTKRSGHAKNQLQDVAHVELLQRLVGAIK